MDTVGITACSNGQQAASREQNRMLVDFFEETGNRVLVSPCIYETDGPFSGTGKERAEELMRLFRNPEISSIYDISGGDMANEVLDYLDFPRIQASAATFWGYSDLTTVINAIYAKTGKSSVLYPVKNLVYPDSRAMQQQLFRNPESLFSPAFTMVRGDVLRGTVVGGNVRCFLKLAGTPYFPDMTDKILLLESLGGLVPQMVTYLSQLRSCGVFRKIGGILLGTFSQMEASGLEILPLVLDFAEAGTPIARTREIGHGHDARAIRIGCEIEIRRQSNAPDAFASFQYARPVVY